MWRKQDWTQFPPLEAFFFLFWEIGSQETTVNISLAPGFLIKGGVAFRGTLLSPPSHPLSRLMMFDRQDQGRVNIPLDFSQTQRLLYSHGMTETLTKPWHWGSVILQILAADPASVSPPSSHPSWSATSGSAVRRETVMSSHTCPEMESSTRNTALPEKCITVERLFSSHCNSEKAYWGYWLSVYVLGS